MELYSLVDSKGLAQRWFPSERDLYDFLASFHIVDSSQEDEEGCRVYPELPYVEGQVFLFKIKITKRAMCQYLEHLTQSWGRPWISTPFEPEELPVSLYRVGRYHNLIRV